MNEAPAGTLLPQDNNNNNNNKGGPAYGGESDHRAPACTQLSSATGLR